MEDCFTLNVAWEMYGKGDMTGSAVAFNTININKLIVWHGVCLPGSRMPQKVSRPEESPEKGKPHRKCGTQSHWPTF